MWHTCIYTQVHIYGQVLPKFMQLSPIRHTITPKYLLLYSPYFSEIGKCYSSKTTHGVTWRTHNLQLAFAYPSPDPARGWKMRSVGNRRKLVLKKKTIDEPSAVVTLHFFGIRCHQLIKLIFLQFGEHVRHRNYTFLLYPQCSSFQHPCIQKYEWQTSTRISCEPNHGRTGKQWAQIEEETFVKFTTFTVSTYASLIIYRGTLHTGGLASFQQSRLKKSINLGDSTRRS